MYQCLVIIKNLNILATKIKYKTPMMNISVTIWYKKLEHVKLQI